MFACPNCKSENDFTNEYDSVPITDGAACFCGGCGLPYVASQPIPQPEGSLGREVAEWAGGDPGEWNDILSDLAMAMACDPSLLARFTALVKDNANERAAMAADLI